MAVARAPGVCQGRAAGRSHIAHGPRTLRAVPYTSRSEHEAVSPRSAKHPCLRSCATPSRPARRMAFASSTSASRPTTFTSSSKPKGHARFVRGLQGAAIRIARAVNRALGRRGAVWGDRYHARILRTPREVRHALVYLLQNWRKHVPGARGHDPRSSARWFSGWRVPQTHRSAGAPVAAARTWLASVGWRRHGLIEADEAPARARRRRDTDQSLPRTRPTRDGSGLQLPRRRRRGSP